MKPSDFHAWRYSEVGKWFFDQWLKDSVDEDRRNLESLYVQDVEQLALSYANIKGCIDAKEFIRHYEIESDRETPPGQDGH